MAEAEGRNPITKLVKSVTSLQIPEDVFKQVTTPSFLSDIPASDKDRAVHFYACQQVEFYWEAEIGSDVPVWARKGDFTVTLPKGLSAIIAWGQYIVDEGVEDEEPEVKEEELEDGLLKDQVLKEEVLKEEVLTDEEQKDGVLKREAASPVT